MHFLVKTIVFSPQSFCTYLSSNIVMLTVLRITIFEGCAWIIYLSNTDKTHGAAKTKHFLLRILWMTMESYVK